MDIAAVVGKIPGAKGLPKPALIAIAVAAVGGAGFVAFKYLTRGAGGEEAPAEETGTLDDEGFYDPVPAGGITPFPPASGQYPGESPDGSEEAITTDDAWVRRAVERMFAAGYQDTANVSRVLAAWLQGVALDDGEVVMVRTAVGLSGRPPSGEHPFVAKPSAPTNPTPSNPAPAPAPAPAAPAAPAPAATVTVRSGDTLAKIFGSKWRAAYTLNQGAIEAAARSHGRKNSGGGHWIYPGTVLRRP